MAVQSACAPAGSSPLTRGKHDLRDRLSPEDRLIPAHAGKTLLRKRMGGAAAAHPRSRGENTRSWSDVTALAGSSPLTRGKPQLLADGIVQARLIPAHAGKTLPDMRFYCADRSDLGNP